MKRSDPLPRRRRLLAAAFSIVALAATPGCQDLSLDDGRAGDGQTGARTEVISLLTAPATTRTGQLIEYPTGAAELSSEIVVLPPGASTPWHSHPVPIYGYVLEGTIQIEDEGGEVYEYQAGQAFFEVIDTPHRGSNPGDVPTKLVGVTLGVAGKPRAEPAPGE